VNYAQYIELAIALVEQVLPEFKGTATEQQAVEDLQVALDALLRVKGSDVTYAQLESLRAKATF
jgi:hypothetical protein